MSNQAQVLTQNFTIIAEIVTSVGLVIGIGLMMGGIFQLKKHAEQRGGSGGGSVAGPVIMILCGSALLVLPDFIGIGLMTFWGTNSPLVYQGGPSGYQALIPPIILLVRVIGVGSFVRGIVLLSKVGGQHAQPGNFGKAMVHIFAGILLVHILGTIELLQNILGFS